jgi:hypothetical protein
MGSGIAEDFTLFISGPQSSEGSFSLFGIGPSSAASAASIYTKAPFQSTSTLDSYIEGPSSGVGSVNLFALGPIPDSGNMSLFAKQDIIPSGSLSLYLYNDKYAQPSGDGSVEYAYLNLFTGGENPKDSGSFNLFISSLQQKLETNKSLPVYVNVDDGQFGVPVSGNMSLYVDSNNDSSVYDTKNGSMSIYLKNQGASPTNSGDMSLYMERPTDAQMPIYINSTIASGDISLYVSGILLNNNSLDLFISPMPEDNISLYTRGFLE